MSDQQRVLIIGAGQAGGQLALQLRQKGFVGSITLVGEEATPPYERPALSKGILTGKQTVDDLLLRAVETYAELDIDLCLSTRVTHLNLQTRQATFNNNLNTDFDILVLATGATPRNLSLPGSNLPGVHLLRTNSDSLAIKARLSQAQTIAIIGGGFIGMEVAASACSLGIKTHILEAGPCIMARSLPTFIANKIAALHQNEGNEITCNAAIQGFIGDKNVSGVQFQDGSKLEVEAVIVGIGVTPNTQLAEAAGIQCDNGIITDTRGLTSVDNVYAIGDCSASLLSRYERHQRLESYQNANQQAENVVASIMGNYTDYNPVPWLWSDQYRWQIQTLGFPAEADLWLLRGDLDSDRKEIHLGFCNGLLSSVVSIAEGTAASADVRILQRMIEMDIQPDQAQLSDTNTKLKTLLKQTG